MTETSLLQNGDALLIIDVQNDFCSGGALAIQEGDAVVPVINEWIQEALAKQIPVCASRDWHSIDHVSFQEQGGQWPPHCIQDSQGAAFPMNLDLTKDAIILTKGVRFDKDQNSAFEETGLKVYFQREGIERLYICGLALDVCVFATVMDAMEAGFQVCLIVEATRPVNYEEGLLAIENMKQAGAKILGNYTAPKQKEGSQDNDQDNEGDVQVCTKAPEWAEHQRNTDDDQPCDDGRTGKLDR